MKLLAIDGPALLRRVYEANGEVEGEEKMELALRHTQASFRKLLHTHAPTHAALVFELGDAAGNSLPGWRKQLHPSYQHHSLPPALMQKIPQFVQHLQNQGWCCIAQSAVEVMDMLATLALRWLQEGRGEVCICSNHRLLHSMLPEGAMIWDHFRQEFHDAAWVQKKYGVKPELVAQWLALVGDAGEGVPGVSRIGQKTAASLLSRYGDLDAVLAGAGILSDTIGQRLRAEKEALQISRQLMQLKTDIVLGVTWKMLSNMPN